MALPCCLGAGILIMKQLRLLLLSILRHAASFFTSLASIIVHSAWGIVFSLVLLAGCLTWLDSDSGHRWLSEQSAKIPGLKIASIGGSLLRDPILIGLSYEDQDYRIKADRIAFNWQVLPLLHGEWVVEKLQIGLLDIVVKPTPPDRPPTPIPAHLTLPLAVRINTIEVAELVLKNPDISLRHIQLSLQSDGQKHQLNVVKVEHTNQTLTGKLSLNGIAPFITDGQFQLTDTSAAYPFSINGKFTGPLRQLHLSAKGDGTAANTQADLLIDYFAPHAYQMLRQGRLTLNGFDPSRWSSNWPHAQLDLALNLQGIGADSADGQLTLINHRPGPLNAQQIPLSRIESRLKLLGETLQLDALDARFPGSGRIQGSGHLNAGHILLDLKPSEIDLASLWQQQPPTRLNGTLQLAGPWLAPGIKANLVDNRRAVHLVTDLGWINPKTERRLAIHHAELRRGSSRITAQGEFGLQEPYTFRLNGDFSALNPAEFAAVPAGSLTGTLAANGRILPAPDITLNYQLQNSVFNGKPLAGAGSAKLENGEHISESALWLALGRNRIDLHGSFGRQGDILQAALNLADLRELGSSFSGNATGQFSLSGTPLHPALEGKATLGNLALPGGITIRSGQLDATLPHDPNAPLRLVLDATDIRQSKTQLERLHLEALGSALHHTISLSSNGVLLNQPVALEASLAGELLPGWHWQGVLNKLTAQTPVPVTLMEPITLHIAADRFLAQGGVLAQGNGRIKLESIAWQPGQLTSRGQLHTLALDNIFHWIGREDFSSDLIFDSQWNLRWTGALDGEIDLIRTGGSSVWRTRGVHEQLAITGANLKIQARQNRIELNSTVKSSRFGMLELTGDTVIDPTRFSLAEGAGLNLRSKGDLPDLSAFSGLISPNLQVAGKASFNLQRSGPLDSPRVSGTVNGDELLARDATSGLYLRDGQIRMTVADDRITLEQAFFRGGEGEIQAKGVMTYRGDDTEATAHVVAKRITLFSSSDLLLIVSGEGEISLKKGIIGVSGQLKADQGEIQYRDSETPRLASDVVIRGKQKDEPLRPPRLTLQVDVDLGKDFRFRGYGVDAQLTGLLRLRAQSSRPLTANGQVEIVEGKYRAYGQRLDIERGVLSFQGAVDNPGLDILAMRRNMQVEAGVKVLGTALNPRVQLYSEPSVPDTEKLSWMLFGHGSENMQGSDATVMLKAVQGLLSGNGQGKGITDEVLSKVGIDDLMVRSVRETDGSPTRIVTISSQLGRNFRISLEKSVNGLRDAVSFTYQLGRNWSLVTRFASDEETLGAHYTHYFE